MTATVDLESEELNFALSCLAERSEDGKLYKKCSDFTTVFLQYLSSKLDKTENRIVMRAYGSAAEGLMCYEPCDVGDVDIMIFPNSASLTIREELLEYSLENPLHVRIKRGDHPVLKSCLVENKSYVATSAVKNFHHAIFGFLSPNLVKIVTRATQEISSLETLSSVFTAHLKNSARSPAVTLNMSQSLGTISQICKQWDMLTSKEPENVPIFMDVAEIKGTLRGTIDDKYRHRVELLKDVARQLCSTDCQFPQILSVLFSRGNFKRGEKIEAQLRADRSQNESVYHDRQFIMREKSVEDETTSSQSKMPRDSVENSSQLTQNLMYKQVNKDEGAEDRIEGRNNGDSSENEDELKPERRPQEGESPSKRLPSNTDGAGEDGKIKLEIRAIYNRFVEYLFGTRTESNEIQARQMKLQLRDRVKCGMDFIPAFRSLGWPKVAREWISRDRKWPSPDIINKVIQEGYHLVVKSQKNNGNPDCDFRISFSHAEYLLSQEMNDIQRECYRCMKRYYRAYLVTEPKSLVTFHLKNILLRTIEETGAEMWTESNRAHCEMRLLGNLLEALTKKDLRHFFVRSYNLFGVDYIEDPEILEFLAGKVEQIMRNPIRFSKQLIQQQGDSSQVKMEKVVSEKNVLGSEAALSTNPTTDQRHGEIKEVLSNSNFDERQREEKATVPLLPKEATQGSSPTAGHGYHGLNDILLEVTNKLTGTAFNNTEKMFENLWNMLSHLQIWISSETVVQVLKFVLKEGDFTPGNASDETVMTLLQQMFDPSDENSFDLSHVLPCDAFSSSQTPSQVVNSTLDIPLD